MFCTDCQNVCSKDALVGNFSAWLRRSTCLDEQDFVEHTDRTIRQALRTLAVEFDNWQAYRISDAEWENLQGDLGFNHDPNNVLSDPELNVGAVSMAQHDWFHVYLVTGLFNYEFGMLMLFLNSVDAFKAQIWIMAKTFLSRWEWPRAFA